MKRPTARGTPLEQLERSIVKLIRTLERSNRLNERMLRNLAASEKAADRRLAQLERVAHGPLGAMPAARRDTLDPAPGYR